VSDAAAGRLRTARRAVCMQTAPSKWRMSYKLDTDAWM
jgi:hypothetical protein